MVPTSQFWLNRVEYPFALREFDSGEGWLNYVDEGKGRTVVFVHGSMTWSFLFRKLIESLSENFRCVAVDNLGFGLSEKPSKAKYAIVDHAKRFSRFMEHLNLRDVTLVVHDAGAPIALEWAAANPNRVRDLVICNSFLWGLEENTTAMRLFHMITNPVNRVYYRILQATPSFIMPPLFADRYRMSKAIQRQYLQPFETHRERIGQYSMVWDWDKCEDWLSNLREQMVTVAKKPTLILWGMKDPMFNEAALDRMQGLFEAPILIKFEESGRFFLEEQSQRTLDEIRWFLMNNGQPTLALVNQIGEQ